LSVSSSRVDSCAFAEIETQQITATSTATRADEEERKFRIDRLLSDFFNDPFTDPFTDSGSGHLAKCFPEYLFVISSDLLVRLPTAIERY
ncbi:MAG: hypothetical protein AAF991_08245, partial [Pseudomonadota bacterium]